MYLISEVSSYKLKKYLVSKIVHIFHYFKTNLDHKNNFFSQKVRPIFETKYHFIKNSKMLHQNLLQPIVSLRWWKRPIFWSMKKKQRGNSVIDPSRIEIHTSKLREFNKFENLCFILMQNSRENSLNKFKNLCAHWCKICR